MGRGERIMQIKNYMEIIVDDTIDTMIGELDMCDCETCRLDLAAISLNNLPPKYIVTKTGELYTKVSVLQQQFEVDVVTAITRAANIVKKFPRHEE